MSRPIVLLTPRIEDQLTLVRAVLALGYTYWRETPEAWRQVCEGPNGTSSCPLTYVLNGKVQSDYATAHFGSDAIHVNSIEHFVVAARQELAAHRARVAAQYQPHA